ncbi:hypothetical protein HY949_03885 [Candidatus Gottesmanbacteria bacterium]|nr:hypothetical protein [Candidatus Gottesmanbacteria bacterium]
MDIFILVGSVGSFLIFLPVHVIALRRISDRGVIPTFWLTYICVVVVTHSILGLMSTMSGMNIGLTMSLTAVSFVLSTLLTGNYFMGIFGLMESSIRMRVLGEVVRAGEDGVSRRTLLGQYNHEKIVDRRLARFISSGDIAYVNGAYTSRKPFTFFLIPALVLRLFWWAFGRTNIVYIK